MLVVDEAAAFKNLYKPQAREDGVPKFMGGGGEGSDRAWQLDFRAAAVRRQTGGAGVVLLTATPAKNSPLEFYNLIQFIDPAAFTKAGIRDPEQFIDRFLKIEYREVLDTTFEVTKKSAVTGFKNLDDLRTIIFTYGEFRTAGRGRPRSPAARSSRRSRSRWTPSRRPSTTPTSRRSSRSSTTRTPGRPVLRDPRPARAPLADRPARRRSRTATPTRPRSRAVGEQAPAGRRGH
jgi:hypothetical protein